MKLIFTPWCLENFLLPADWWKPPTHESWKTQKSVHMWESHLTLKPVNVKIICVLLVIYSLLSLKLLCAVLGIYSIWGCEETGVCFTAFCVDCWQMISSLTGLSGHSHTFCPKSDILILFLFIALACNRVSVLSVFRVVEAEVHKTRTWPHHARLREKRHISRQLHISERLPRKHLKVSHRCWRSFFVPHCWS